MRPEGKRLHWAGHVHPHWSTRLARPQLPPPGQVQRGAMPVTSLRGRGRHTARPEGLCAISAWGRGLYAQRGKSTLNGKQCLTLGTRLWGLFSALHLLHRFNHVLKGARILRTKFIYSDPSSHHKTLCIPPRLHFLTCKNRGSGQTPRKMTLLTVPGKPRGQRKNKHWHRVNGAQILPAPTRSLYTSHLTCSGHVSLPVKWGRRGTSSDCGEDEVQQRD